MNVIDYAPGADDEYNITCYRYFRYLANTLHSGSGVAISMELARIMATRYPPATMIFAAVAGEE